MLKVRMVIFCNNQTFHNIEFCQHDLTKAFCSAKIIGKVFYGVKYDID